VRDYELVMVISPEGGDEGFTAAVDRTQQFIKDRGGQILEMDLWGRRRLAYTINRFTEGFYAIARFSFDPQQVRTLESNLDLAEDVIRHLVVKLEEVKQ
jgi:small subunit ribosomal protein S6